MEIGKNKRKGLKANEAPMFICNTNSVYTEEQILEQFILNNKTK